MFSKENFSFAFVALSVGWAMFVVLGFKVAVDMNVAELTLKDLKLPLETVFLVCCISLLNGRKYEELGYGFCTGVVGGIYFYLTSPHPEYVYREPFALALYQQYGSGDSATSLLICTGVVLAALLTGVGLCFMINLIADRKSLKESEF